MDMPLGQCRGIIEVVMFDIDIHSGVLSFV